MYVHMPGCMFYFVHDTCICKYIYEKIITVFCISMCYNALMQMNVQQARST